MNKTPHQQSDPLADYEIPPPDCELRKYVLTAAELAWEKPSEALKEATLSAADAAWSQPEPRLTVWLPPALWLAASALFAFGIISFTQNASERRLAKWQQPTAPQSTPTIREQLPEFKIYHRLPIEQVRNTRPPLTRDRLQQLITNRSQLGENNS